MWQRAFTLIEIFLVMMITSILVFTGVAAWHHFIRDHQLNSLANRLVRTVRFARSAAITSNTRVTFCGSSNKKNCDGDWNAGQIIFEDQHKIMRYEHGKLPKNYQLTWHSSLGRDDKLQFESDGFTNGQQGSFKICKIGHEGTHFGLSVTVLRSGRISMKKVNCSSEGSGED